MTEAPSTLETRVLETSPHDLHDLSGEILRDDLAEGAEGEAAPGDPAPEVLDLISPDLWAQQWGLMHDMAGGMVQARTGNECPLGAQSRSEGGMIACQAAYDLISISPAAPIILGKNSGYFGQVLAIGMHGFACVQLVKAAAASPPGVFTSTRSQEA